MHANSVLNDWILKFLMKNESLCKSYRKHSQQLSLMIMSFSLVDIYVIHPQKFFSSNCFPIQKKPLILSFSYPRLSTKHNLPILFDEKIPSTTRFILMMMTSGEDRKIQSTANYPCYYTSFSQCNCEFATYELLLI